MSIHRASCTSIAAALTGDYRPELVFILSQELGLYKFYQTQITECDNQIEECLAQFTDKVDVKMNPLGKPKRRGKKQPGNAPQFDLRTPAIPHYGRRFYSNQWLWSFNRVSYII